MKTREQAKQSNLTRSNDIIPLFLGCIPVESTKPQLCNVGARSQALYVLAKRMSTHLKFPRLSYSTAHCQVLLGDVSIESVGQQQQHAVSLAWPSLVWSCSPHTTWVSPISADVIVILVPLFMVFYAK